MTDQTIADTIEQQELASVVEKLQQMQAAVEKSIADAKAGNLGASLSELVKSADGLKARSRQDAEKARIAALLTDQTALIDEVVAPALNGAFADPAIVARFKQCFLTEFTVTFSQEGKPLIAVKTLRKAAARRNGNGGNGHRSAAGAGKMPATTEFYSEHTTPEERAEDQVILEAKVSKAIENGNGHNAKQMRNSRFDSVKRTRLWGTNGVMAARYPDEAEIIQNR